MTPAITPFLHRFLVVFDFVVSKFFFEPRHGVAASKGELAFRDPTASLSFPSFVQNQLAVGNQRRRLALIRGVCSIMDTFSPSSRFYRDPRRLFHNDSTKLGEI